MIFTCTYQYKVSHWAKSLKATQNCYQIYKNNSKTWQLCTYHCRIASSNHLYCCFQICFWSWLNSITKCHILGLNYTRGWLLWNELLFQITFVYAQWYFIQHKDCITFNCCSYSSFPLSCEHVLYVCSSHGDTCISYCKTIKDSMFIGAVLYGGCNSACSVGEAYISYFKWINYKATYKSPFIKITFYLKKKKKIPFNFFLC